MTAGCAFARSRREARRRPTGARAFSRLGRFAVLGGLAVLLISSPAFPPTRAAPPGPKAGPAVHVEVPKPAIGPGPTEGMVPGDHGPIGPLIPTARYPTMRDRGNVSASAFHLPTSPGLAAPSSPRRAVPTPPTRATATERPRPGQTFAVGWFSGFVNDSTDLQGIGGVPVIASSTGYCPTSLCQTNDTKGNGAFNETCVAPGGISDDYTLQVADLDWWANNETYSVCAAGATTDVGTIYLVRDGVAVGRVVDASTGRPVANVSVSAVSRDGTLVGLPSATTGANGTFEIAVPPEDSIITYAPPPDYLSTFNFTDAPPGTGTRPADPPWTNPVNLGTIALTPQTLVTVNLVNAVTGQPLDGDVTEIEPCNAASGACDAQGALADGPNPNAWTLPGPTYFKIDALGYVESYSVPTTIPAEPPGTTYSLGTIPMTPFGGVTLEANLSAPAGGSLPSTFNTTGVEVGITACSLDGYLMPYLIGTNFTDAQCLLIACLPLATPTEVFAPPLRDLVGVTPDEEGLCDSPPSWSSPPAPPAYQTSFPVNLTGGHDLGRVVTANLTVGDFVYGQAFDAATGGAIAGCFTVEAYSTDSAALSTPLPAYDSCTDTRPADWAPCASLGTASSTSFCAPVPPGDSLLEVLAPGFATNWTWVHVPQFCCRVPSGSAGYPAPLARASPNHVASVNLTPLTGSVSGWGVVGPVGNATLPDQLVASACPVFPSSATCVTTSTFNGSFAIAGAPAGLDNVELTAPGYSSDQVWVDVPAGGNATAGTVPLEPFGTLSGRVVDANGTGIFDADVDYCPVDAGASCYLGVDQSLGIGYTGSDGSYNGTVPGGWLPWATYVVVASAPGYSTDWTFANVSVGGFVTLPPIVLTPIDGARPRIAPAPRPAGPVNVWITGRLLDNLTGSPPDLSPTAFLGVCPIGGGLCDSFGYGINSAGFFNASIPAGLYDFNVTAAGFVPLSQYLNATAAAAIDLGTLYLRPDWWVEGRVALAPWTSITRSSGGTYGSGYAPFALATGCDSGDVDCQLSLPISQNGTFNVTVPPGHGATIDFGGTTGLLGNSSAAVLVGPYTELDPGNVTALLPLFGEVGGRLVDAGTLNTTGGGHRYFALPGAEAEVDLPSLALAVDAEANADGYWTAYLPPVTNRTTLSVIGDDPPAYGDSETKYTGTVPSGLGGPTNFSLTLARYGWAVAELTTAGTGAPVGDAAVVVAGVDPYLGVNVSETANSNLAGLVNVSAPPGEHDTLTVSAALYNSSSFSVPDVSSGATAFVNGSGYARLGALEVDALATLRSDAVLFSPDAPPLLGVPAPSVEDGANGRGLPYVGVSVTSSDPTVAPGITGTTNWNGQFLVGAPIGAADTILLSAPGYLPLALHRSFSAGENATAGAINLTGYGVVAGTVHSAYEETPVGGANVTVCGPAPVGVPPCQTSVTNASGVFWATTNPGVVSVWVNASGFVGNESIVRVCPDCWVALTPMTLAPFGGVEGTVRGIPSGLLLEGANVSLCPIALFRYFPCGLNASTDSLGRFFLQDVPGTYELSASAPGYNTTSFSVDLGAGELVLLGNVFLLAFGNASGSVYDGATGGAIDNASVLACPTWPGGVCAAAVATDAAGDYTFSGPPGPYLIAASANNFQTAFLDASVGTGAFTQLAPMALYPIGDNTPATLTGRVVRAGAPTVGLDGATVALLSRGVVAYATSTNGSGGFYLSVAFGTYTLVASLRGDAPNATPLDVSGSMSGLVLALGPMGYGVSGTVVDGITGHALADVRLEGPVPSNGSLVGLGTVAVSGPSGAYAFTAPNGSYTYVAAATPGGPVPYALVPFGVVVDGHGTVVNVSLTPPHDGLGVTVVDGLTDLPIAGALVTIAGTPEPGYPFATSLTTFSDGVARTTLYAAAYLVSVSAVGYGPRQEVVNLSSGPANWSVTLTPLSSGTTAAGPPPLTDSLLVVGLGLGAAAVVAVLLLRRGRRRTVPAEFTSVGPDARSFGPEP